MDFSHSQSNQQVATGEDPVMYVEELANDGDYWLSITDAARVCRVQDVSIRRAITRGVLPVRRQRAGQNKRTRFVRASDLAQAGFPIIDESAAITTEIGKVDVLSIPRQQQQIVQEHQALLSQLSTIQETLACQQERIEVGLHSQKEYVQASLQAIQDEQTRQSAALCERIEQEQQSLQQAIQATTMQLADEQRSLAQKLAQERADSLTRDERLQTALATLHQQVEQEQAAALARDEHLQKTLDMLQTMLQEHQQATQRQFIDLATTQQTLLKDYVNNSAQIAEQKTQARLLDMEQSMTNQLEQLAQTFNAQLAELTRSWTQFGQMTENLRQSIIDQDQEITRALQRQQAQLSQYERLLPLLPYTQQRLLTEQDMATWSQTLANLEARQQANWQRELERYQPLLALLEQLSPEHLERLTRLLAHAIHPQ